MEGRPLDDGELIERARRGDMQAYGELVQRYQADELLDRIDVDVMRRLLL